MKTLSDSINTGQWALFLDRDGVINVKRDNDYVKSWKEFVFMEEAPRAIAILAKMFSPIVIVTNQQGIGKGLYTRKDLDTIHTNMLQEIKAKDGHIDKIYYCPSLKEMNDPCRKPGTGMALEAKKDFPQIDFKKSVIAGDSMSDIEFGKALGMITVYIHENPIPAVKASAHFHFKSLYDFAFALYVVNR